MTRSFQKKIIVLLMAFFTLAIVSGNALSQNLSIIAPDGDPQKDKTERFGFALIGDIPRIGDSAIEPDLEPFLRLRDEINKAKGIRFVIHNGDYKTGGSECSDENMDRWYDLCNTFTDPFLYIVGDNEWTDCHRPKCGAYDPVERLDALRKEFYSTPFALGKRGKSLYLTRQSETTNDPRFEIFSENFRWVYKNVMFVGLNIQGSNNNYPTETKNGNAGDIQEFTLRNEACNAFLQESFEIAKKKANLGIMVIIQASMPQFERISNDVPCEGFESFVSVLTQQTIAFKKPVVLVNGDSHYFRIDKPMYDTNGRRIENFTRVETFGAPDVHWVRVHVDYRNPNIFIFKQQIVEDNLVGH